MKYLISALLALLITQSAHAADYLDETTNNACKCIESIPSSADTNSESKDMQIGLCLIQSASPEARKKFKADYGLDFDHIAENGNKLGEIIGLRMATVCPSTFMKLAQSAEPESNSDTKTGVITKIDSNQFVVFTLKESNGATHKLLWLKNVKSNIDFATNYNKLMSGKVKVKFELSDLFDPKIGEYRTFKIIQAIDKL